MDNDYMRQYMRKRREERRATCRALLGDACVVCGSVEDLEFDHIDPSTKLFTITSPQGLDGSWQRLLEELDKCQLLCRKHHLEKSRNNKELGGGHNRTTTTCGMCAGYSEGCRCERCRLAKKLYRQGGVGYKEVVA